MLHLLYALLATARSSLKPQRELALQNLALRQQLAILQRKTKRPKLTKADRAFWVALSRLWPDWQSALILVKPQTVIGWHRKGFKLYWSWKSQNRGGRPPIDSQIRTLIRRIAGENPTWGAPRIHGELLKLGFEVAEATFRVLYVFLVLEHERRRIVYFNVTEGPSAQWTGQQLVNAFPYDSAPKYVIRDRDKIYGAHFVRRARDRDPSAGLPRPRHRGRRAAPTAHPADVPRVLPRIPDPPGARQGRPRTTQARVHRWREGHRPPDGRRAASSLHTTRSLSERLDPA